MFNTGDKVVLIDDDNLDFGDLQLYQVYTVDVYMPEESLGLKTISSILLLKNINAAFDTKRFISLYKFRKNKIEKIINNI